MPQFVQFARAERWHWNVIGPRIGAQHRLMIPTRTTGAISTELNL
jgi:hypothetical protein